MASRHRSHTSMSAHSRPVSRASTTSATSQRHDDSLLFGRRELHHSHAVGGPEAALLQYGAAMVQPPEAYQQMPQQHQMGHQHTQSASFSMPQNMSFGQDWQQEPMFANHIRVGSVPAQMSADMAEDKRRKGSAVTATNDKELREMLSKNEGRPLREVAQEVIQKERTPMAEKTKQLFAMLWLRAVCKPAKTSVPRNRVYSQYANRCGTERVVPLNPASFGKLVRVIFPGIQTRRLGVRGESKYHYVDLALEDENTNPVTNPNYAVYAQIENRSRRSESASTQQIDFNNIPRLQADTAAFPPTDGAFDIHTAATQTSRGPASQSRAFAYPDARGMQPGTAESMTYSHTLRFPSSNIPMFSESEPVNLPPIQPYLPPRTDNDTAEALYALYRTHCTSLIDSIRFCKEKQFFRLYASFHGTLTVPVQKLFTHPNLAPWIEQCDLTMYRTMVRFVSRLTLQAAPVVVINVLSNISGNLHAHIAKTFTAQPAHVLAAKLRPATVFAALLHRLIRVNQSAHAAANLLTIDQNREQMWREWSTMVNPKRVLEAELPHACAADTVYNILTSEMRSLLEPLQAPPFPNDDPYAFSGPNFDAHGAFASFLQSQTGPSRNNNAATSAVSTTNVLDRWSAFIAALPARFPTASARTVLHCISAMGTAALRDITIMNGVSYGHWWVLKIFVDEMALWLAEMGGFLEPEGPVERGAGSGYASPVMLSEGAEGSRGPSRMSTAPAEMNGHGTAAYLGSNGQHHHQHHQHQHQHHHQHQPQHHQPPPSTYPPTVNMSMSTHNLPFQPAAGQKHHQYQHQSQQSQADSADLDDSGIGLSLLDDTDVHHHNNSHLHGDPSEDELAKYGLSMGHRGVGMNMNVGMGMGMGMNMG